MSLGERNGEITVRAVVSLTLVLVVGPAAWTQAPVSTTADFRRDIYPLLLKWDESLLPASLTSDHWAFQPLQRPVVPRVKNAGWVRNPIDAFIAAGHEAKGLTPAPAASRRTLVRRLSLDLLGLPPAPEEVERFLMDDAPDACEHLVDRLLASPHYGERWARHWLDVARWAESEGYESNHLRPYAWRSRDWVVAALNQDMPFADFVRAQVAGDEIVPYADDHLIATGFLAACRLSSNEEDKALQRNDIHVDIVNATASAFLGITLSCAQCHNHRFDPFTAQDYYRFQGFFVKGQPANLVLQDQKLWAEYLAKRPEGYEQAEKLRDLLFEQGRANQVAKVKKTLSAEAMRVLDVPAVKRTPAEERLARETDLRFQFTPNEIENGIPPDDRKLYDELKKKVERWEKTMPDRPQTFGFYSPATSPTRVQVLPMKGFYPLPYEPKELVRAKPKLLAQGDVHRPSFEVDVGWPAVFGATPKDVIEQRPRVALADWLTSPRNPLAARVYVNRIWQHHFGRGIVATPGDFGTKGAAPTHPELLDWLAMEFLDSGGSTKHIQRLILTSNTYRQGSSSNAANARIDPENTLWWHWQPRRLEAEAIRDSMLAVSGELDASIGGPSAPDTNKSRRRSLYVLQRRGSMPAFQPLFDGPSAVLESCARRHVSTVPLQALYLLNNEFSLARSKAFAARVHSVAGEDCDSQVTSAFLLALGRPPDAADLTAAQRFFQGRHPADDALTHFCQALFNLNEFLYLE